MKLPYQKIYAGYMVVWPGLAALSLRFIPEVKTHWLVGLPSSALLLIGCVVFAAIAIYFVFPTEVIRVPGTPVAGALFVFGLPVHMLILLATTPQNIWEAIALGFVVECFLAVTAIAVMVIQKIKDWHTNWLAVVILLGAAAGYAVVAVPFITGVVEHNIWTYCILASSSIVGAFQNIRQMKSGQRASLPHPEIYILVGVAALLILPGAGALVGYLAQ